MEIRIAFSRIKQLEAGTFGGGSADVVLAELQPKPRPPPGSEGFRFDSGIRFNFAFGESTQNVAVKKLRLATDDDGSLAVSVSDFTLTRYTH